MKNEKKLVLELNELPLRAEKLDSEKIQAVFGGCVKDGGYCLTSKDCCDHPNPLVLRFCEANVIGGICIYTE